MRVLFSTFAIGSIGRTRIPQKREYVQLPFLTVNYISVNSYADGTGESELSTALVKALPRS
jgi:hypothetical protein